MISDEQYRRIQELARQLSTETDPAKQREITQELKGILDIHLGVADRNKG